MNEWDMDLWVHFTRTGSLSELDDQDPEFLAEEIQGYLERDGLQYETPGWMSGDMVWVVTSKGYEDEVRKEDWTGPYVRAMQVDRVDLWEASYHFVEVVGSPVSRGTRMGSHLTEIEGFVKMRGIVGAPTREEAFKMCHDFINHSCSVCGTMKWRIMR